MSVTVSTCEQVNRAPTNNSTAKQLYSFPKANRFGTNSKLLHQSIGYNLPTTKAARFTSFGYGSRNGFNRKGSGPSPGTYDLPSEFRKQPKGKAFSFGISHSSYAKVYNENDRSPDKNVPGPGTYSIPDLCGNEGLHYTLKPRLNSAMFKTSANIPGPGTYETPQAISKTGNYFNSKFKNSRAGVFSPARSVRFADLSQKSKLNPGPGTYDPSSTLNKEGNYFVSKFKSSLCRTFYHFNRDCMPLNKQKKLLPGPGMYRLPSDFGYYESAKKNPKSRRRARSVEDQRR